MTLHQVPPIQSAPDQAKDLLADWLIKQGSKVAELLKTQQRAPGEENSKENKRKPEETALTQPNRTSGKHSLNGPAEQATHLRLFWPSQYILRLGACVWHQGIHPIWQCGHTNSWAPSCSDPAHVTSCHTYLSLAAPLPPSPVYRCQRFSRRAMLRLPAAICTASRVSGRRLSRRAREGARATRRTHAARARPSPAAARAVPTS